MAHFDRCSVESGGNRELSIALATPFDDFQYGNGSKIEIDAFIVLLLHCGRRFSARGSKSSPQNRLCLSPLSLQIGLPSRLSLPARLPPPPSFIEGAQETKHRREAASGASGMGLGTRAHGAAASRPAGRQTAVNPLLWRWRCLVRWELGNPAQCGRGAAVVHCPVHYAPCKGSQPHI